MDEKAYENKFVTLNGKKFKVERRKFKHLRTIGKLVLGTVKNFISLQGTAELDIALFMEDLLDKPYEILKEFYPELTQEDVDESFTDELVTAFTSGIGVQGLELLKNAKAPLQQTMTLLK